MTVYSPLSAVSAGIYAALNVAALLTLAPGGVFDTVVPEGTTFPYVSFRVEPEYAPAFGARAGSGPGSLTKLSLRCSMFSLDAGGMKTCQAIDAVLHQLLEVGPPYLVASGVNVWRLDFDRSQQVPDQLYGGQRVQELVSDWSLDVEEAA